MAQLTTIVGDATKPEGLGKVPIIIPHICNDDNAWGAGFVVAVTKAFGRQAEDAYHYWGDNGRWVAKLHSIEHPHVKVFAPDGLTTASVAFALGATQFVRLADKKTVIANMIGQHKIGIDKDGRPPIRYGALVDCMRSVRNVATLAGAEIHCPKFGSDLAGGNWDAISDMILEFWVDNGINVTVYEFIPKPVWKPLPPNSGEFPFEE